MLLEHVTGDVESRYLYEVLAEASLVFPGVFPVMWVLQKLLLLCIILVSTATPIYLLEVQRNIANPFYTCLSIVEKPKQGNHRDQSKTKLKLSWGNKNYDFKSRRGS